jgi:hypothetical protein
MNLANALSLVGLVITGATLQAVPVDMHLADETRAALALRARYGVNELVSPSTIYVHSESAHHMTEHYTRIATRGADGRWTVISIGEEQSGPVGPPGPPELIPEERRTLSARDSQHLDELLRRPALYRQHSPHARDVGPGTTFHTIEIVTPSGHAVMRWTGRLPGLAGGVADLIMGRG